MEAVLRREAAAARGVAALALVALGLGLGLGVVSALPYEPVAARVDALAWDGSAEPFTREFFAALVWRVRAAAAACALVALAGWRLRGPLSRAAAGAVVALSRSARDLGRDAARAWARTPVAERWTALALFGAGAAVRAAFLFHPLRRDEAFTFNNFVAHPWLVALTNTAPYYGNNNHLLNTALAKLSCALFGADPWAIRLPAAVAGALLVPAVYAAGRLVYGRGAALLAAALAAFSPALVVRATDARGYAWVMLAAVVCWACAARGLRRPGDVASWAIFAVAAAAGFWAVPTMLLPFGGVALWFAACAGRPAAERGPRLLAFALASAAAAVLTLALHAPALAVSGVASFTDNHWVKPRPWDRFVLDWGERAPELLALLLRDPVLPLGALLVAGLLVAILFPRRCHRRGRWPVALALPLVAWCAAFVVTQRMVPWTRVWSFALPLFLVMASGGLAAVAARAARPLGAARRSALGCAAVLAVGLASAPGLLRGERVYAAADSGRVLPLREAAAFLAPRLRAGDRVLAEGAPGLVYELSARGVPRERFLTPPASARRLFVLAADAEDAARRLVDDGGAARDDATPRLLARFERYRAMGWYAVARRPSATR